MLRPSSIEMTLVQQPHFLHYSPPHPIKPLLSRAKPNRKVAQKVSLYCTFPSFQRHLATKHAAVLAFDWVPILSTKGLWSQTAWVQISSLSFNSYMILASQFTSLSPISHISEMETIPEHHRIIGLKWKEIMRMKTTIRPDTWHVFYKGDGPHPSLPYGRQQNTERWRTHLWQWHCGFLNSGKCGVPLDKI